MQTAGLANVVQVKAAGVLCAYVGNADADLPDKHTCTCSTHKQMVSAFHALPADVVVNCSSVHTSGHTGHICMDAAPYAYCAYAVAR